MLQTFKNGQGSVVVRAKLLDSSSSVGAGLTGLTSASAGLIISTIADVEAAAVAYTVTGATIESITTLGTYAAPTATKCRFKELDSTNHKGVYEFQFADARFAVANAKSLLVSVLGAANLAQTDFLIQLQTDDPYVAKLTAAQIATGLWQDTTAGDFTVAGSIGKSIMNGVALGTGLTVNAVTTGVTLAAAAVQAIWDALTSALTTPGSIGKWILDKLDVVLSTRAAASTALTNATWTDARAAKLDNLDAAVSTRSTYAGADTVGTTTLLARLTATRAGYIDNLSAGAAALEATAQSIKAQTDKLPASPAATSDIPTANQNADALLNRNIAGGSSVGRLVKDALRFLRNKWAVSNGLLTVYQEDDATPAWTGAVSTDASADPVVGNDPS